MREEEHEEVLPSEEEASMISQAVDEFLGKIRVMGTAYGALLAVSAPGDACMVACQAPEDKSRLLQLVTAMISWMSARLSWSAEDVKVFTDRVACDVARHIELRAQTAQQMRS